jgi:hypothetical protein
MGIGVHGPSPEREEYVEQILQKAGCTIIPDGESQIALVWHPNEMTLFRRVKSIRRLPTVRIVVGIPRCSRGTRSRLGVYGVRHFFQTPIDVDDLLRVVEDVMGDVPLPAQRN